MKITEKQIEFFLGKDNLENACLTELVSIANGEYSPQQFKEDVINHWENKSDEENSEYWKHYDERNQMNNDYPYNQSENE